MPALNQEPPAPLLARCAPLARSLAELLCATPNGHDDCGALHGVWPELRRLGVAAGPDRHAVFFADALGERAARGSSPRVLIAGCADWGMLETVAAVYRQHQARLDVTVVDRCPTPMLLCAWYGAQIGLPVRTAVSDLIDYRDAAPFDLICTHSLLGYPPLPGRRALVANWQQLLRAGGAVITANRLTPVAAATPDPADRAHAFGELAVQRCLALGLDPQALAMRARTERFARAQVSHPVGDAAALRTLFEAQGFDVVRLDVQQLGGLADAQESVVGAARGGSYGELVAVKR